MGFMGFLKFLVLCADFLAWPVFALGYPLCASIRAIETGSKHHMRKLVIYWTLFSLISLFELAFVKIIEWIPFWSCIKLIAICWLAVPQFNGACHVYESFVHPYLSLNFQAVMSRFYKAKEDKPVKTEIFLDVAEKYIKENGSEALEKLITGKKECKKPDGSYSDDLVQETDKKNAASTLDQLKESDSSDSAQKDKEMLEPTKKTASSEAKLVQHAQPNGGFCVEKKTDAPSDVKEMTPPGTKAEIKRPETPPPKKIQREWTCALCLVKTSSENNLKDHLRGIKHKTNWEELKASKKNAKVTGSSPKTKDQPNKTNSEAVKKKPAGEASQEKPSKVKTVKYQLGSDQGKISALKHDGGAGQAFKHMCLVCDVKLLSDIDLSSHLMGKKHLANIENGGAGQVFKCLVCDAKLLSDVDLASHLKGKKHLANIEKW